MNHRKIGADLFFNHTGSCLTPLLLHCRIFPENIKTFFKNLQFFGKCRVWLLLVSSNLQHPTILTYPLTTLLPNFFRIYAYFFKKTANFFNGSKLRTVACVLKFPMDQDFDLSLYYPMPTFSANYSCFSKKF